MPAEGKSKSNVNSNAGKPKKRKYLPHGKSVRKGAYPLRPGVQGFFITCDGGRESQAAAEALGLLEDFYEQLVDGKYSSSTCKSVTQKPLNKITKFESDSSDTDEDDTHPDEEDSSKEIHEHEKDDLPKNEHEDENGDLPKNERVDRKDDIPKNGQIDGNDGLNKEEEEDKTEDLPMKRQRKDTETPAGDATNKIDEKPIDDQIQDELKELRDRKKRHFVTLDSGCNGVIFIQMHRRPGDPTPAGVIEHMLSTAASTRKHMSRFILRILPAEVSCYASEEEISRAIKPLISEHFPSETSKPQKFAVLFEARANTGVDRMTIINAVAKSVPEPHKVDLSSPDKTIIVEVAKTVCLIGIAQKYKELLKYNLRQLTSPQT